MRNLVCLVSLALVAASTQASAPAAEQSVDIAANAPLRVAVQPAIAKLYERSTIAVSGLESRSLEVRLVGASYVDGTPLPWRSLRLLGSVWRGNLPTPALHGIYPIELRSAAGAPLTRSQLFLRVFDPGTPSRPSFEDPADVARWWVRAVPHATLVALKAWPRPAFDRRDRRLHRLFVVAYSLPGHPRASDRLGMFVTAVRDGYRGGWRLLEATVEP
ncbi:MAG: hypothetical protein ACJ76I_14885 [Gaiellaceae bacterium]